MGRRGSSQAGAWAIALVAQTLLASTLAGQTIDLRGVVFDNERGVPLPGAMVMLPELELTAETGEGGAFAFADLPLGTHTVTVIHPSFGTYAENLLLEGEGSVDIEIRLSAEAIVIAPVDVEVFTSAARTARGRGTRINTVTRDQIVELIGIAPDLGEVLRQHVAGISSTGACIEFRRPTSLVTTAQCHPPLVVVDGVRLTNPVQYLRSASLDNIESLEVLPSSEAGTRFGTGSDRGVVVVRTRRAEIGRDDPAAAIMGTGKITWNWELESQTHSSWRTLGGAVLGVAAGMTAALVGAGDCSPFSENKEICPSGEATTRNIAAFALPILGATAGANLFGSTDRSRGRLTTSLALVSSSMFLGYFLGTGQDRGSDADVPVIVGRTVIAVGVPITAMLADRWFRKLRR